MSTDTQRLRELLAEATPVGDWTVEDTNEGTDYRPIWMVTNPAYNNPPEDDETPWLALELHTGIKADADLIATAMNVLPELLDRVDAAEAEVTRLRATNARLNRRAQIAESAINEFVNGTGRGKQRAIHAEAYARAEEARAETARLRAGIEALIEVAAERAFDKIAVDQMLTILPTGPDRAAVPGHWRNEAEAGASVPVADLRNLLGGAS